MFFLLFWMCLMYLGVIYDLQQLLIWIFYSSSLGKLSNQLPGRMVFGRKGRVMHALQFSLR
jgi:hypothetical protein